MKSTNILLLALVSTLSGIASDAPEAAAAELDGGDPAEFLYREALAVHKRLARSEDTLDERWQPWSDLPQKLEKLAETYPLETVGALEESILVIERAVAAAGGGDGEDGARDAALSKLYAGYAKVLAGLDDRTCTSLAQSPYTLLIGAETADANKPCNKLCLENAENAARNAASIDATNQDADRILKELLGDNAAKDGVHERKPKEFVAELFDSFAETFDEKLRSLDYKVPEMVSVAAEAFLKQRQKGASSSSSAAPDSTPPSLYRAVLDAGCGTGLVGKYLRPIVTGPLVGVDASQKMLDRAATLTTTTTTTTTDAPEQSRPLYDGLLAMDLEEMTLANVAKNGTKGADDNQSPILFDLVVAADVLVYFGRLDRILSVFASLSSSPSLTDDGAAAGLIFSCELTTESEAPLGFKLTSSGRFAHTKAHCVDAANAAGYKLQAYQEIVPRTERGAPVKGHLFSFVLTNNGSKSDSGNEYINRKNGDDSGEL